MTRSGKDPAGRPDDFGRWIALAERSQRAALAFWERQFREAGGHEFRLVDPLRVAEAFGTLAACWLSNPQRLLDAQSTLLQQSAALWQANLSRLFGGDSNPVAEPDQGDRRFRHAAWSEVAIFDHLKQSYLLAGRWLQDVVRETEGLDPATRQKVEFYARQFVSACAPSNFVLTNPEALQAAAETGGESLLTGFEAMLDDLEQGRGRLKIRMTEPDAFEVGKHLATTPGKVILQNDLMQLIQYAPSTERVYRRPLLIVPPWINKFYILDLQPRNSLIRWAVDHGHTVFVISWVNPRRDLAHKNFEDYMRQGPLAALEAIERVTGERQANLLGFCIGGILTLAMLACMAAKGDDRITSATILATLVDFTDVGEAAVFIDDDQIRAIERHTAGTGYLDGRHMADMFSMMREKDLIWSFVAGNYLLGRTPFPFDLLYWNSDSTRLPATMLVYYLRKVYLENGLRKPGHLVLEGTPVDLAKIGTPLYCLATRDDHIAPWRSCFAARAVIGETVRFVLGGSGHIAGIINPPAARKYGYWTGDAAAADPEAWLSSAEAHGGSWWPDWTAWLARRGGRKVAARQPGEAGLPALEDAPGSYVRDRSADG